MLVVLKYTHIRASCTKKLIKQLMKMMTFSHLLYVFFCCLFVCLLSSCTSCRSQFTRHKCTGTQRWAQRSMQQAPLTSSSWELRTVCTSSSGDIREGETGDLTIIFQIAACLFWSEFGLTAQEKNPWSAGEGVHEISNLDSYLPRVSLEFLSWKSKGDNELK